MEEVIGSLPIRSTKYFNSLGQLGQRFLACGGFRPLLFGRKAGWLGRSRVRESRAYVLRSLILSG